MDRYATTIAALCLLAGAACTEVIEEDLDGSAVILLTPPAGYSSTVNQVQFKWEEVPHATHYRLQVVRPDFISPQLFVVDTLIEVTACTRTFTPGSHQWRVRAENSNSHTDYYTRDFTIVSTEELTGQVPVLVSPADDAITNATTIAFDWDTLPFTDDHRFVLHLGDQNGTVEQDLILAASEVTVTVDEGIHTWGVQAQNAVPSVSAFSYRTLTVDATSPSVPVQLLPASGAMLADGTFTFVWQSGVDALTATEDSLIVKDALLQTVRALGGLSGNHPDSLGTGSYTWIVRTVDGAGNLSSAGPISFTVP